MLRRRWQRSAAVGLAALATLLAGHRVLVVTDYALRDPDSTLYEYMADALAARPVREWVTPRWAPDRPKAGLFVEHPAPFLWPAAALGKLGVPRPSLFANLCFYGLLLLALFRVAERATDGATAWACLLAFVASPAGVQFLVRANQEVLWAFAFLGALFCQLELKRGLRYGVGLVFFLALSFAAKGVLAALGLPALLYAGWRRGQGGWALAGAWAAAAAAVGALAAGYEAWFQTQASGSFFAQYLSSQLGYVARHEGLGAWRKLASPPYYLANLVWFALPGSALAVAALWRRIRGREGPSFAERLALVGAGSFLAALALLTRRAARYLFPLFPLVQLWGAEGLLAIAPKVREWLDRQRRFLPFALLATVWMLVLARALLDPLVYLPLNPLQDGRGWER